MIVQADMFNFEVLKFFKYYLVGKQWAKEPLYDHKDCLRGEFSSTVCGSRDKKCF